MKNKILLYLLGGFFAVFLGISSFGSLTYAQEQVPSGEEGGGCNGIKLNTNFPIIGNCIETKAGAKTDPTNAFPFMLGALTKIIMAVILVVCLILIIVAGIMRSADKPDKARKLLTKVAITILLLGFSGVILKLINPNFFY